MDILYVAALFISILLAVLGVLNRQFDDNVCQRVGLSAIALASCANLFLLFRELGCCEVSNSHNLFAIGFAVYAVGTYVKVLKHRSKPNEKIPH